MAASRSSSVGSIDPGRVEGGVAEQLGDGDDVGAGVDQVGSKGMAQDVRGDQLGQARDGRDVADDLVGGTGGQSAAGAVEEHRGVGVRSGPDAPDHEPRAAGPRGQERSRAAGPRTGAGRTRRNHRRPGPGHGGG